MGWLSNSSPIFIVAESAWITSIGKWRIWVKACNCWEKRHEKENDWKAQRVTAQCICDKLQQLTSSCPPQAAVCSTSLQYFSNSSGNQHTHTQTRTWLLCVHIKTSCFISYDRLFLETKIKIKVLPVVYMSPVLVLVRKGRKSSAWPLMCSALRDRRSFTHVINPG